MKHSIEDLAIFGGQPAFGAPLHVGRPNIGDRQRLLERVNDILDRKWLTNQGPYVEEFERRVADLVGVKHCIAVCNATLALEIASRAAGLTGEVIVPSFTFIATAHALHWQGLTPVFCDVDPRTHTIDPNLVEQLITPSTTGIVGVHLWGRACDIDALTHIARRHGLKLLFDAAHAFGCSYRGRLIGGFGNAEVFSFHATKVLNAFEGGAIVSDDDELVAKARLMKNFGFADYDRVVSPGTNGKLSEVAAAMGLTSLESMDAIIAVNERNYRRYQERLADVPGLRLLRYAEGERHNYHYIILEVDEAALGLSRDQLQQILWAENVLARRYFYPGCHRLAPYASCPAHVRQPLLNTERLARDVLSLPTGTAVDIEQVDTVGRLLRFVAAQAPRCSQRLARFPQEAPEPPAQADGQVRVSVLLTTYNHEKFIAQAIDSVLMQQTSFAFELVIIEDCSTDRTRDIVVDFRQRYPDKIRLILSESNRCDNASFVDEFLSSRGQYIASLDGDDYWTSAEKLQKQVEFLDSHPECTICFHNVVVFYEDASKQSWNRNPAEQKQFSTLEDLLAHNFIAGCSPMYRAGILDAFPDWYRTEPWADSALYILLAQHGAIGYIDEVMGAYRVHGGGLWSRLSEAQQIEATIRFYERMNARLSFAYQEPIRSSLADWRQRWAEAKATAAKVAARRERQRMGLDDEQIACRIRELLLSAVPADAAVIVVDVDPDSLQQTGAPQLWHLPTAAEGPPEQLFSTGARGEAEAPWIGAGASYEFRLYAGTRREALLARVSVRQEDASAPPVAVVHELATGTAWIRATPNPVPRGEGAGTTTISWSTGDGSWGEVYLCVRRGESFYPADSAVAIEQLEALRAQGAGFLVLPQSARWWLEHYAGFAAHLEQQATLVAEDVASCQLYALSAPEQAEGELVSVVIPCYNQAQYLGEAIASVLAQTHTRVEVIVVDDGATDHTAAVAAGFEGVRYLRQDNQGLAAARNAGLNASTGQYLIFLDADDRLLPHAFDLSLACLRRHPDCAFVYGHCTLISSDGSALFTPKQECVERDHYRALLDHCYIWTPGTVMFRRAVFDMFGGFDISVSPAADYDLYLRVARRFPIACHGHVVAEYRQHGANMSSNSELMLEAVLRVFQSQWEDVQGNTDYEGAYKIGVEGYKVFYGDRVVQAIRSRVAQRTREIDARLATQPGAEERAVLVQEWKTLYSWVSETCSIQRSIDARAIDEHSPVLHNGHDEERPAPRGVKPAAPQWQALEECAGDLMRAQEDLQRALGALQRQFETFTRGREAGERELVELRLQIRTLTVAQEAAQGELRELRRALAEQADELDLLVTAAERIARREHERRAASLEEWDQVEYQLLARQVRSIARKTLPGDAIVIVVSKGDDNLLDLAGRQGWHFPQSEEGWYAGSYPADGAEAIAHLERLRARGGEFLLFPSTAFWWLEHYAEFQVHLDTHYGVLWRDEHCIVYQLVERGASGAEAHA
jgi:dTDP-4-amino-4,6-dideoxygalactose transaminase/glycosyltransferase involved in cell wall biosynthesis